MSGPNDQEKIRRDRRAKLLAQGLEVYPARTKRTITVADLIAGWTDGRDEVVVGRVRSIRLQGKSCFLDLEDDTGRLQIFLQQQHLAAAFDSLVKDIDLGDFLEVAGSTFTTKRGERSLDAAGLTFLAKALRPLPSSWHGLEDAELRYRFRELDIVTNPDVKEIFSARSKILEQLRAFLQTRGFMEVETPMLQAIPGGANARPFITHHNALDADYYLRIAPELYLKRLIVAGYGRVYEIARCFRNEGIDRDHNPEFTQVELYAAYTDYRWMMDLTEELIRHLATVVNNAPTITHEKKSIDLTQRFPRRTYHDVIKEMTGLDIDALSDDQLRQGAGGGSADIATDAPRGKVLDELFKTQVRSKLIEPTFIIDYPVELSPLAKKKSGDPRYVEMFQLIMGGTEIAKAFSELNDPVDQRERFAAQEKLRAAGDDEAQRIDEAFLQSLEYGMPPVAGLGLGIDRLAAVLTNQPSLKEVILFPTLKPIP